MRRAVPHGLKEFPGWTCTIFIGLLALVLSCSSLFSGDEAVRRFATRRVTTSSSLSMLSANLAKDSSRVGGLDGLDVGGGVYEGWSG
ncbi:hypothetical protein Tco_0948548 [Tanacetum coccineum]